jgi:hypothetical protein
VGKHDLSNKFNHDVLLPAALQPNYGFKFIHKIRVSSVFNQWLQFSENAVSGTVTKMLRR